MINHKGTKKIKDGEDWHGLQTTKLKNLAKLFKPLNRDAAPLTATVLLRKWKQALTVSAAIWKSKLQDGLFEHILNYREHSLFIGVFLWLK